MLEESLLIQPHTNPRPHSQTPTLIHIHHTIGVVRLLEESLLIQQERVNNERELTHTTTTLDTTAEKLRRLDMKYQTLKTHHKSLQSELTTLEQSRVNLDRAHISLQAQYEQLLSENHVLQVTGAEQRVYCHDLEQAYLQLQADAKLIETLIAGPAKGQGLDQRQGLGQGLGLAQGLGQGPGPGLGLGTHAINSTGYHQGQGPAPAPGQGLGPGPALNAVGSLRFEIERIRAKIRELEERLQDATLCVGALAIYGRKENNRADELACQVIDPTLPPSSSSSSSSFSPPSPIFLLYPRKNNLTNTRSDKPF